MSGQQVADGVDGGDAKVDKDAVGRDGSSDDPFKAIRESLLPRFARETTAHGVGRLAQGSPVQRATWALIILAACAGFSTHLGQLVQQYLSYPVSTEFISDGADFTFPAVTLCPTNFLTYYPTYLSGGNSSLRGTSERMFYQILQDVPLLYYQLALANWSEPVPLIAEQYNEDAKLASRSVAYRQTFQADYESVIYCRYNSKPCTYRNFSVYKDEERFLCYTFVPENRTVARVGQGNGLFMFLYSVSTVFLSNEQQIGYLPGFEVVLHEPGTRPDFNKAFIVPLGSKTTAVINIDSTDKVDRPETPCLSGLPNVTYIVDYSLPPTIENATFYGTQQDCVIRLMQQEFLSVCGCFGTHLGVPEDLFHQAPPCHALAEELFYRDILIYVKSTPSNPSFYYYMISNESAMLETLTSFLTRRPDLTNGTLDRLMCFHRVRERLSQTGVDIRQCQVTCINTEYRVDTARSPWPNSLQSAPAASAINVYTRQLIDEAKALNRSIMRLEYLKNATDVADQGFMSYLSNYMAVLDLFPSSSTVTVSKEVWSYPMRNLFSDLGGILGLWIGVSIMTFVEIMELVGAIFVLLMTHRRGKHTAAVSSAATIRPVSGFGLHNKANTESQT